ncbi:MAG: hypothetical protein JO182_31915 [Acidobacteriaceae bacterium]|nr:hypothetical protein [Acidobacteriaceae bacterium]MBV9307473.1 hypothetical protein [Acidobacteriaceae bacterium]MBV9678758.1 hypothetical protein [Acidobacteriaceae bacterium]MBV9937480.1 hypothetical protein [Acidobacteriaceae bacterium]
MNVDFTPEQQQVVQQAIQSGRIRRPEEAAREAFSLWVQRERAKINRPPFDQTKARAAVARIRELRKGNLLPEGVTIRDLINEGRA